MPDPLVILQAMGAAGITAAVILLAFGWPWRASRPVLGSVGAALGTALGFYAGCWWLELLRHWPPREDLDRLLLVLMPAVIAVELMAAVAPRPTWLAWSLRLTVAAGAARVLLHNSIYLEELAGPDTRQWSPIETWTILGGLAAALAAVWASLVRLVRRAPGRSVPLALALACSGAAVCVMLSGYASGGQLGFPLAAALAGAAMASVAFVRPPNMEGAAALGIVGLFALLLVGHRFAELQTLHAVLLLLAPVCCWLPELPYLCRLGGRLRGGLRLALTAVPVAIALLLAQQRFVEKSRPATPGAQEPSVQDYLDFGR